MNEDEKNQKQQNLCGPTVFDKSAWGASTLTIAPIPSLVFGTSVFSPCTVTAPTVNVASGGNFTIPTTYTYTYTPSGVDYFLLPTTFISTSPFTVHGETETAKSPNGELVKGAAGVVKGPTKKKSCAACEAKLKVSK